MSKLHPIMPLLAQPQYPLHYRGIAPNRQPPDGHRQGDVMRKVGTFVRLAEPQGTLRNVLTCLKLRSHARTRYHIQKLQIGQRLARFGHLARSA